MSGYQIPNNQPTYFNVVDPVNVLESQIQLANSTIVIPLQPTTVTGAATTITADQLLNGNIQREAGAVSDTTATATQILAALRARVARINNQATATIPNGTRFSFVLRNTTGGGYTLNEGAGVVYDNTKGTILNNTSHAFIMIVTKQTAIDGSDRITICDSDY